MPVPKVTVLCSFEKIVKPAVSVVEMTMSTGSIVVASPLGKVVAIGVLTPVDKVITAPSAFETTVWPAELTEAPLSHRRTRGSPGELHATACLRCSRVEGDEVSMSLFGSAATAATSGKKCHNVAIVLWTVNDGLSEENRV